jgi:hypothetical protein
MAYRLIIDADDFGLTTDVSKGIIEAFQMGAISSTNALTTSEYFLPSVELAKQAGLKKMGIHLNIDIGDSLAMKRPMAELKELQADKFFDTVKEEFFLQTEKLIEAGIELTHLTSHKFIVDSQQMIEIYIELAKEYKVPVRRLKEEWMNQKLQQAGCQMTEQLFINEGNTDYSYAVIGNMLEQARNYELSELICHVGYNSDELMQLSSLNEKREVELALFTDEKIKQLIQEKGVKLVSFEQFSH